MPAEPPRPRRRLLVIGIGTGNPDHVTIQAVAALNRADVIFIPRKGTEKDELAELRREICRRHIARADFRTVEYDVPRRRADDAYGAAVDDWHEAISAIYERLLTDELDEDAWGAVLVWGDPSLYDSTLRIVDRVSARGALQLELEVIAGITSVQALCASHRIPLNGIGQPVLLTTGRRLAQDFATGGGDSVVVMLDGRQAFRDIDPDATIFWGAYLGSSDEITISGRVGDVAERIEEVRAAARASHGWIMDIYLLRKASRPS